MPTITIRLDEETDARLKRRLARSGLSLSEFVRAAVTQKLAASPAVELPYEAWLRLGTDLAGSGESGRSASYRARIKERLRAKHRG